MNITGKTMIFKNEKGMYSTALSTKNAEGKYENMYIAVNFKKGIELENKTLIDVEKGFLSFYKDKNGMAHIKLIIMEFSTNSNETENTTVEDYSESDLPF